MQMHHESVINGSGHLGSPKGARANPASQSGNYIITTKLWGANSIFNQFTTATTVDEIINANTSKVPQKAKNYCNTHNANTMHTQRKYNAHTMQTQHKRKPRAMQTQCKRYPNASA